MRLNHTIFIREERLTIAWRLRSAMMLSEEGYDRRCIMALTQIQPVAHRDTARGAVLRSSWASLWSQIFLYTLHMVVDAAWNAAMNIAAAGAAVPRLEDAPHGSVKAAAL
jgi:hypothetical protein